MQISNKTPLIVQRSVTVIKHIIFLRCTIIQILFVHCVAFLCLCFIRRNKVIQA